MRGVRAEVPIGKRVGSVVVLGCSTKRCGRNVYCRVKCTCGTEFETKLYNITHDKIKCCKKCAARMNLHGYSGRFEKKIPIGTRFGNLVVVGESISLLIQDHKKIYIPVQCDCGAVILERKTHLLHAHTLKCIMCRNRDMAIAHRSFKSVICGKTTRLHKIWQGMLERCYRAKCISYKYYGAKGVTVCDEWRLDYNIFAIWAVTHGYQDDLTIDRINPFGNYTPDNCRWVTWQIQNSNKRNNFRQPVQA